MANDLSIMLNHDQHLKNLLKYYLGMLDPNIGQKHSLQQSDWEYITNPDGSVSTFRDGVVADKRSGSFNIRDGYTRALAHALKRGESPNEIRVISIINHSQSHWTSSVTNIELDSEFIDNLKLYFTAQELKDLSIPELVNRINQNLHSSQTPAQIEENLNIIGAKNILIEHYDSHNPNPKPPEQVGNYYKNYKATLNSLIEQNPDMVQIVPKACKNKKVIRVVIMPFGTDLWLVY
tara:strand:+ start:33346 stop:34050 length:705 start_codon:yes stop_codon:yes gene_type:complete